jgi:RimJ/RimL family protein N-acetyltransferase
MTETTEQKETKKPEPGTGHIGQAYLVGESIYLRPIEKDDTAQSVAVRPSPYPGSTSRAETWMSDDLADENPYGTQTLVIVRKSDDRVVGSIKKEKDGGVLWVLRPRVDRLFGDVGERMRIEATILLGRHVLEEEEAPALIIVLDGTETAMHEALTGAGWVETARHREMCVVEGQRADRVYMQAFNAQWLETLGDPRDIPLERTGTGIARPVPPSVGPMPDPPKNALMVGNRVYLAPITKEDTTYAAKVWRGETETFFDIGRHLPTSHGIRNWLDGLEKTDLPRDMLIGVYLRENGLYIGDVMLLGIDWIARTAETGSFFHDRNYRGAGYGSEAKQLLLEYAFEILDFHMVESWVLFSNTRSAAALRKQGYTEAGIMAWAYPFDGTFNNGILFDLLREEWRAMPRKAWGE